jgi:hypothetical protein
MTTTAADCATAVLARAEAALDARRRADVELMRAAVDWAHARPSTAYDDTAGWGDGVRGSEGHLELAGEGTPQVAEFAPFELAAVLGWTADAAKQLMGDGLELVHRLPALWALACELRVSMSTARLAADHTRDLAPEAAAMADRLLVRAVGRQRLTTRRVKTLVDEARLYHDPDRAIDDEQQALAARRVQLTPGNTPATMDVSMVLDTADAEALDRSVTRIADELGHLGDGDPLEVRRARAVGILADPAAALRLLDGSGSEAPLSGSPRPAKLFLHLQESSLLDLDTFPAAVRVEGLPHGPSVLSSDLVAMWLSGSAVTVTPVVDLNDPVASLGGRWAVDHHDPPEPMADYVRLRDPVCVFPGCQRSSHACDLDHIDPYVAMAEGGPPGQTNPDNLAPLCRGHHRAKTHGDWNYLRLPDGGYAWVSPHDRTFSVPHAGSH